MREATRRQKGVTRALIASFACAVVALAVTVFPPQTVNTTETLLHQLASSNGTLVSSNDTRQHFDLAVQPADKRALIVDKNMLCCTRQGDDIHHMAYPYFYGTASQIVF